MAWEVCGLLFREARAHGWAAQPHLHCHAALNRRRAVSALALSGREHEWHCACTHVGLQKRMCRVGRWMCGPRGEGSARACS